MTSNRLRLTALAVGSVGLATVVVAHPDDPKVKDIKPPYLGPSYRSAEGGVAGVNFNASGMVLKAWITLSEFTQFSGIPQDSANDCWGYTSPSGREYALIGLQRGTGFVEITDPTNPVLIDVYEGPDSVWRDMKIYQNYSYSVSEGGWGIQVFNLNLIDQGIVTQLPNIITGGTESSHNVALNTDSGRLYRCGGGSNGLRIYSLANPASPSFLGSWPDRYVHDAQIVNYAGPDAAHQGREIAFCCSGFNGGWVDTGIDVLDVTDPGNIQLIARYLYPQSAYSHQAWLSEDQRFLYLNDELEEGTYGVTSQMHIIDVSDLDNPIQNFAYTNNITATTHNLYVRGDLVFAANYSSGVRVFDISSRESPGEIAFFDTQPDFDQVGYTNLWSNFPFFPSGAVIGSDRTYGLFVWEVDLPHLSIELAVEPPDLLDPNGGATIPVLIAALNGQYAAGTAKLHYDAGQGFTAVDLVPSGGLGLSFDAVFPELPCPETINYYFSAESTQGQVTTNPLGAPNSTYESVAASSVNFPVIDNFETDMGWSVQDGAGLATGTWQRGVPVGGLAAPTVDADGSGQCYVTENNSGQDIDGGETTLTSPVLSFQGAPEGDAFLSYARWYSNNAGATPNTDAMPVEISNNNGQSWVLLENVTENAGGWVQKSFRVDDFVPVTTLIRVRFRASDFAPGSYVEAGVDDVRLVVYECDEPGGSPDINGDGFVNVQDLVLVIISWGPCPPGPCAADVDGDGTVGVTDMVLVITNWS